MTLIVLRSTSQVFYKMFLNVDLYDAFPISLGLWIFWGVFLVAQLVKNPPALGETWVWPLGWEDPPAKGRLPTSVFWPREFHGQYSPWGCKESDMTEWLSFPLSLHGFGGRKTAEMECPFYHVIQSTCLIPGNVDLDHLAEIAFVMLFHCQVTLFLPLHIVVFFRMKSPCITHS